MSAEGTAGPPRCRPGPRAHHGQETGGAVAADGAVGEAAAPQALHLLPGLLQHPSALGVLLLQIPQLRGHGHGSSTAPGAAGQDSPPPGRAPRARPGLTSIRSCCCTSLAALRCCWSSSTSEPYCGQGRPGQGAVPSPRSPRHGHGHGQGQGTLTVRHFCCRSATCASSWAISSCCRAASSALCASSSDR